MLVFLPCKPATRVRCSDQLNFFWKFRNFEFSESLECWLSYFFFKKWRKLISDELMALTSKSILQRYGKERRFDESGLVHNGNGPNTFILSPLTGIPGTGTSFYRRLRTPAHRFGPKMNQAKDNSLLSRLLTVRFNDANVSMKPTRDLRTTTFCWSGNKLFRTIGSEDPWKQYGPYYMEVLFYFSVNENWRLVRIDKSGKTVCQK